MEQRSGRTPMAMKFLVSWIVFPLCLASVCISEQAAAVTMGYVGANIEQAGTCDEKTGICSLTVPIGGYSVPPGNPNDYGMCGIMGLSGNFARAKNARIIIVGNQYQANLEWTGGGVLAPIQLEWTCAHLTEFSGLPAASKFALNQPMPVTSTGGSAASRQIAGEPDACIWTGIALVAPPSGEEGLSFDVHTEVESAGNKTVAVAQALAGSVATFAFCNTFTGKSSAWKYLRIGPFAASPTTSMPVDLPTAIQSKFWCFMVGVQGDKFTDAFDANLQINPMAHVYQYVTNKEGLYWNCLPFSQ
jgi:hypothetical protein